MSRLFNPHDPQGSNEIPERLKRIGLASSSIYNNYFEEDFSVGDPPTTDDLLLEERIIFISKPINAELAHRTILLLLYLQNEDDTKDITLYINSPGGLVSAGMAIYDTMQFIKPDVSTVCVGKAMSMASILLAAGVKGKRYCLPHSTILIHQPLIGMLEGQASELEIEANEMIRLRKMVNELLAQHTGQPLERVELDTDRDYYLTAEQAVAYGLVDEILQR